MRNVTTPRNIYPTAPGRTVGQMAGGSAGAVGDVAEWVGGPAPEQNGQVQQAIAIGNTMSPIVGLAVFAGLSYGLILIAKRTGDAGDFSTIKGSMYNILFISLVAVAGIPAWKYIFTRLKVPGVSTWVLSS